MARARHAQRRRGPLVASVVGAAAVVALVVAGIAVWPRHASVGAGPASPTTADATPSSASPPSVASPSGSPTRSPSGSASGSPTGSLTPSAAAKAALQGCITKVRNEDAVLVQAKTGVQHWAMHVQAQTDADNSKINLEQMKGIWKMTRMDGPDDVQRYQHAKGAAVPVGDACQPYAGAPSSVVDDLKTCESRVQAQTPALAAADVAMTDWANHLAAMRRTAEGQVPGPQAQQIWIDTWRSAPKHLKPYEAAIADLAHAPHCG